jgi:TetR/AcrR family transcriptional regulator
MKSETETSSADLPVPEKRSRAAHRVNLQAEITTQAVRIFAESGYEGTSIALVAEHVGISKQNLLYYFPNKLSLYQHVLDEVLDEWLARMSALDDENMEPEEVLRGYIKAKLRFSRERPWGSRVYAMEVITGARLYGSAIKKRVVPVLRKDIAVFEKWIAAGKIAPIDPMHLLFAIWSMTQSYADFSAQMALVLNRKQLARKDFDMAEKLITDMVLATVFRNK